jgi:5'-deoxynucleotidase YfbR-like HD superfamily hydrolase
MIYEDIYHDGRFSGLVKRWHTWPVLKEQTVAEHTWQVMRIWWEIFGPMEPHVSTYLLWHDGGEVVSGDVPFYAKRDNPNLKAALDSVEAVALYEVAGLSDDVDPQDRIRAKCCDLLEMLEHCVVERGLGNRYIEPPYKNLEEKLLEVIETLVDISEAVSVEEYLKVVQRKWGEMHG